MKSEYFILLTLLPNDFCCSLQSCAAIAKLWRKVSHSSMLLYWWRSHLNLSLPRSLGLVSKFPVLSIWQLQIKSIGQQKWDLCIIETYFNDFKLDCTTWRALHQKRYLLSSERERKKLLIKRPRFTFFHVRVPYVTVAFSELCKWARSRAIQMYNEGTDLTLCLYFYRFHKKLLQ